MSIDPNQDDLTVAELRKRAAKLEVSGRSSMNKAQLAAAVADAESGTKPARSAGKATRSTASSSKSTRTKSTAKDKESTTTTEEAGDMAAPSIGPHTTIVSEAPEDRLARGNPSQVDAMGHDKRRQVMGESYGPSLARQAAVYGGFIAVMAVLFFGASIAVKELDKPDPNRTDTAPWAASDAPPVEPAPIDFPRSVTP
ncbi:MAG: hypothetical protein M3383_00795 [Actinomycetota bacterium]|nr:hypothetical protein [Actinomycetota bacterium]